jgi:intracellular sulfur oxidation DsrE/DsrF family protein
MPKLITTILFLFLLVSPSVCTANSSVPDDHRAIGGLNTGKVVFDVNISAPNTMILYLSVVQKTISDLKKQGITPDVIIAFRGGAVSIMSIDSELNSEQEEDQLLQRVQELKQAGAYLEACNIAAGLFGVDSKDIFPGIVLVGNTFVSLTGYQNQGYALIPLY